MAVLEEQAECLELKKIQQNLDSAVGQLRELSSHQQRYDAGPLPQGSVGAPRWQDYQRFLARLGQAVAVQGESVENGERLLEAQSRRWREKRKRVEMLQQLLERYRKAKAERDEVQMQKTLDDLPQMEDLFGD